MGADAGGRERCVQSITAFNGAAVDAERERMLLWGSNTTHSMYAFEVPSRRFVAVAQFGEVPTGCLPTAPATAPGPRYTYSNVTLIPTTDSMFTWHGDPECPEVWLFDVERGLWRQPPGASADARTMQRNAPAVFDQETNSVFVYDRVQLRRFDVATETFTATPVTGGDVGFASAVLVPSLRRLYIVGARGGVPAIGVGYGYFDLGLVGAPEIPFVEPVPVGCEPWVSTRTPAAALDPVTNDIVGWAGGNDVFVLDPTTHTCRIETYEGGPGAMNANGVFNRLGYFESLDGFILLNRADQGPFILRRVRP